MKLKLTKFGISLIVSSMLFGCSGLNLNSKETKKADSATTESEQKQDSGSSQEEVDYVKYNAYIDLSNDVNDYFYRAMDSYFNYFGDEETFKIPEDGQPSLYSIHTSAMDKAFEVVDQKPVYDTLDPLVKQMQPLYKEISEKFSELSTYYEAKSYVDDNYQKAKDLHASIVKKALEFDDLFASFDDKLAVIAAETRAKDLENAEKEGYLFTYNNMKFLENMRNILDEIEKKKLEDATIASSDVSTIQPLYDEMVTSYNALLEKSKDKELMTLEGFDLDNSMDKSEVERYIQTVTEAKVSVTDFLEQVKSGESFTGLDLEWAENRSLTSPDGSIGKIYYEYGELISAYNNFIG